MESLINYVPVFMQNPETRSNLPDDFGKEKAKGIEDRGFEEESFGPGEFEEAEFEEEGGFGEEEFGMEEEESTPLIDEPGFDNAQDSVYDFYAPSEEEEEI